MKSNLIRLANSLDQLGLISEANIIDRILFAEQNLIDATHWKAQPGTQYGSNEGGVYTDKKGNKYYVKFAKDQEQARQEVASAKIHEKLGVNTLKPILIKMKDRIGTATAWRDDLKRKNPKEFEDMDEQQSRAVARMHHAGVLTKNWDTVGLEHDNILFHDKTGDPHAVDQGGSFSFRAMGGPKEYGSDIAEIKSYRDKYLNGPAAHVFSHIFSKHPHIEKEELKAAKEISRDDVLHIFEESGVKNPEKMADTFIQRRDLLLKHYEG